MSRNLNVGSMFFSSEVVDLVMILIMNDGDDVGLSSCQTVCDYVIIAHNHRGYSESRAEPSIISYASVHQ